MISMVTASWMWWRIRKKLLTSFCPVRYKKRNFAVWHAVRNTGLTLIILAIQASAQAPTFYLTPSFPGGSGIAVADFNRDGILDVATSVTQIGCGCVFLGNGDGTFRLGAQLFVPPLYLAAPIATADFNGDGIPDVLTTGENNSLTLGSLFVFLGKGDGTFQSAVTTDEGNSTD